MTLRSWIGRIGRGLLGLTLVALVAVFVVQAAPGVIGAEHSYVVLTGSMSPAIHPGDAVVVDEVAPGDVREGDVVTFRREADQPPVTHRVVEVLESDGEIRYRTKGDNNEDPDPGTVHPDDLVGEVWFTLPYVGVVTQFGNSTRGAAVLVGVPFALLILSELWSRSGKATVTTGSATDAAAGGTVADDAAVDGDAAALAFTGTDLRLGALGFGTFAVYASYVAVRDPTGISVAVAVGAGIAVAFHLAALATLRLGGADAATDATAAADAEGATGGGADD